MNRASSEGRQFSAEVQRAIAFIREYPDAGAPVRLSVRRALVERFPYAIVYRRDRERVHILAVAHLRKRPAIGVDDGASTPRTRQENRCETVRSIATASSRYSSGRRVGTRNAIR